MPSFFSAVGSPLWSRGGRNQATMTLTITGHAHSQTLLEAAVLATVAVHAHDQAVLILHAHLVVNVLLNAAAKETLAGGKIRKHIDAWGSIKKNVICLQCALHVNFTLQPSHA